MSHITIVINRSAPAPSSAPDAHEAAPEGIGYVTVSYTPPDSMSDADVGQAVKRLYKQVKDIG